MFRRPASTWTPAALLLVVAGMGYPNVFKYGAMCWTGAAFFAALAWYIHGQGWGGLMNNDPHAKTARFCRPRRGQRY